MHQIRFDKRLVIAVSICGAAALAAAACGDDSDGPTGGGVVGTTTSSSSSGGGVGGGTSTTKCEEGEERECTVDIDENNCFVGVQYCEDGKWGLCQEPVGGFHALSLTSPVDCTTNPCNPTCQQYDEDPAADLEATGLPPPPGGSGSMDDLPVGWQDQCFQDKAHGCNIQCTSTGYCQMDTYCDDPPGDYCKAWSQGAHLTGISKSDITIKVVCDPAKVPVCNRGDTAVPAGIGISTWASNQRFCGDSCGGQAYTTGLSAISSRFGTCYTQAPIDPGECIDVDCSAVSFGATSYHANGCDEFDGTNNSSYNPQLWDCGAIDEDNKDNNHSVYHPATTCGCSADTLSSTLSPVTMYLVLDNSRSMSNQNIWNPAKSAVTTFLSDPQSDAIRLAFRMYGDDPAWGCNRSSCNAAACAVPKFTGAPHNAPQFLSDAAYETALINYYSPQWTLLMTPHQPVVQGMSDWGVDRKTNHSDEHVVLVYITDGGTQGACTYNGTLSSAQAIAAPAFTAAQAGVPFYTVALPQADLLLMNELSAQGGTGAAIDLTGSSDVGTDLSVALNAIRAQQMPCNMAMPNAAFVDPNTVTVNYDDGAGNVTPLAGPDPTCSNGDEYYFDPDATNPTDVVLCSGICGLVRGNPDASILYEGACIGGYQGSEFIFDYQAVCDPGLLGVWNLLSYDTTTPFDGTVMWEMNVSPDSAAAALAGPYTLVSTADASDPDVLPAAPVLLHTALNGAYWGEFMSLKVTVNATSDQSSSPLVHDWNIQYSCESAE